MKLNNSILIMVLALFVFSCTEPYTPVLKDTYLRLAIEGQITDVEGNSYVRLTKSQPYLLNQRTEVIEGAIVTVLVRADTTLSDGELIGFEESKDSAGLYFPPSGFVGTPKLFYTLDIQNVDVDEDEVLESYFATDYMVQPLADEFFDSINVSYIAVPQFDFWQIGLFAYEPLGANWYAFQKFKNGVPLSDSIRLWNVTDDFLLDGNYVQNVGIQTLSNQDSVEYPELGDTISMEMWNISEEYFDYSIQVQEILAGQNPLFSGPPANPFTNVSEGAVGFFSAYSINKASTIVKHIPQEAIDRRDDELR